MADEKEEPKKYTVETLGYAARSGNCEFKSMKARFAAHDASVKDPKAYWDKLAKRALDWFVPYREVCSGGFEKGDVAWFADGKLNVSYNCIDRHVRTNPDKVAIIHEGDKPGTSRKFTYKEVLEGTCKIANVLKRYGVKKGDCVAIYMPMIPEAAFAMLACARIGAPHSVIFAGFSKDAIRDRVLDANCKYLICADEGTRGGRITQLKKIVDEGLAQVPNFNTCFMWKHTNNPLVNVIEGRDVILNDEMENERPYCPCEVMDSEDPLFMLYTSGSTGKPKGVVHTQAGYLLYTWHTVKTTFDLQPNDVFCCVADVGWITGHSYIVYGPLCAGTTTVMFESIPTYPNTSRYWDMCETHGVTQFYTAPTAIRLLAKDGSAPVEKHDLSKLRVLGTVGEPINPEAWKWYHEVVGKEKATVVDTYWQTETGGHILTPIPGCTDVKPGSATYPFFGIDFAILDKDGKEVKGNPAEGVLCIKQPWPGMARTVYANHKRYLNTYMSFAKGYYFTGDGAKRDKDGMYWITGRVDDVVNVAGHRLGTAEIEACLAKHPNIAEAACIGIPDDIKGQAIFAYCVPQGEPGKDFADSLKKLVRNSIGPFAAPKQYLVVPSVPKTRSGKVMRRILRKIASKEYEALGDVTTLANADVVQTIIKLRKEMK